MWLYKREKESKTVLGEGRNFPLLNTVLQVEHARKKLESGELSLARAAELTDMADDNIRNYLDNAYEQLQLAQASIHLFQHPEDDDVTTIRKIVGSAEVIADAIRKRNGRRKAQEAL